MHLGGAEPVRPHRHQAPLDPVIDTMLEGRRSHREELGPVVEGCSADAPGCQTATG